MLRRLPLLAAVAVALVGAAFATAAVAGWDPFDRDPNADIEPTAPATAQGDRHSFDLRRIATGLVRPTYVSSAPGDPGALWVLEQTGRVIRLRDGRSTTVLDLRREVRVGGEQGMLGVAFHPDFARNRRLFLHYSDRRGDTRVIEVRLQARLGAGRPAARRELLYADQPEENHNGGALAFGPDGRLYLGLGDGGGTLDPNGNAQDLDSPFGKLLATDVDRGGRQRWDPVLYGLRNPWRFWFDPALSEVWIGDVGQDAVEEVDRVLLELDEPPKNLGWVAFEGSERTGDERALDRSGELIWPVAAYRHPEGCSITGGLVYRGAAVPRLRGRYLYGDYCTGALWSLEPTPEGRARDVRRERTVLQQLSHIGTDSSGELVLASGSGEVYRAVAPGE